MTTLVIHENSNGKLFSDRFSHVDVYDTEIATAGEFKLMHRGVEMGIVKIEAMRTLPFSRLSDLVSFLNVGKPVQSQASLLNRRHNGGKTLAPDTTLMHLVIGYVERNMEAQGPMLQDWWQEKQVKFQHNDNND